MACTTKLKGTTLGPDIVTQKNIVYAYKAISDIFYNVFGVILNTRYYSKYQKQATGVILKKPRKLHYSAPNTYRVISLLNYIGKVLERILAQRLSYLAETTTLIYKLQIGERLKKSVVDTALLLINRVEQNKQLRLIRTTLFVDVKGAFDYVAKNQLIAILKDLKQPYSLIRQVLSFLDDRLLELSFKQKTKSFKEVQIGTL